jgi:hypothetical protein
VGLERPPVLPRTPEEADGIRQFRPLDVASVQRERANATSHRVQTRDLRYQLPRLNAAIGLSQFDHFPITEVRQSLLQWADDDVVRGQRGAGAVSAASIQRWLRPQSAELVRAHPATPA